nr:MAG TPA: hypothetical protein [Caudoviricetes sp.]
MKSLENKGFFSDRFRVQVPPLRPIFNTEHC